MKNDELEKVEDSTLAGLKEMGAFGLQVNLGLQYMFLHSYILAFRCRPIKKLDEAKNSMAYQTLYCPLSTDGRGGITSAPSPPPPHLPTSNWENEKKNCTIIVYESQV